MQGFEEKGKRYSIASGVAVALLGIIVMIGWYTHSNTLIQILPNLVPMQFNTALGFLLSGFIILTAKKFKLIGATLSIFLIAIATITLIQYIFQIHLLIDEIFIKHYITTQSSHPGRMSPNTALCFLLTGINFLTIAISKSDKAKNYVSLYCLSITGSLGLLSVMGYALHFDFIFSWGDLTAMAINTAIGFVIIAAGNLPWPSLKREYKKNILLSPTFCSILGSLCFVFFLLSWQAILKNQDERTKLKIQKEAKYIAVHIKKEILKKLDNPRIKQGNDSYYLLIINNNKTLFNKTKYPDKIKTYCYAKLKNNHWFHLSKKVTCLSNGKMIYILDTKKMFQEKLYPYLIQGYGISITQDNQLIFEKTNSSSLFFRKNWSTKSSTNIDENKINIDLWPSEKITRQLGSLFPAFYLALGFLFSILFVIMIRFWQLAHIRNISIQESQKTFSQAVESSPNAILIVNKSGEVVFANSSAEKLWGYKNSDLTRKTVEMLMPESFREKHIKNRNDYLKNPKNKWMKNRGTLFILNANGKTIPVEISINPIVVKNETNILCTINDISAQLSHEKELLRQSRIDIPTTLPNRLSFQEYLFKAILRVQKSQHEISVLIIDIDNFESINQNYGYTTGDLLIKNLAEKLITITDPSDVLARIGGDQFGIILEEKHSLDDVRRLSNEIFKLTKKPTTINKDNITFTISIAAGNFPSAGTTVDKLIENIEVTLRKVKAEGGSNIAFYTAEHNKRIKRTNLIDSSLKNIIAKNELSLVYQPIINPTNQEVAGFETLARWNHPKLGNISPSEFIPIAEKNRTIIEIGDWITEQAFNDFIKLKSKFKNTTLSINTSIKQLENDDFLITIKNLLANNGIDPKAIFFEVTETALMTNFHSILENVLKLKQLGIRFALDDFGTGYSSMTYLKHLPITSIKIDQSFIRDIIEDQDDATIVRATIQLAHNMSLKTVAEGVETKEQLAFLIGNECDAVQGFYFAKPMSLETLLQWKLKKGD